MPDAWILRLFTAARTGLGEVACWAVIGVLFTNSILAASPIRVVVWDEQQERQAEAYDNYLGNEIAAHLRQFGDLEVVSKRLDDPGKGMDAATLDECDVLIWWGHARNGEVSLAESEAVVQRIKQGKLSLIALHSSHWASPFIEAMNERTRLDARLKFPNSPDAPRVRFEFVPLPGRFPPARESITTPAYYAWKRRGVVQHVRVDLPNCCFPDYRAHGKPSMLFTRLPDHPIAAGLPNRFPVHQTEMYNEPFHVPEPDELVFVETWEAGERFRSGAVWDLGKGKVFYFRPGHEQYPVYKQPEVQRVILNAVRWLGAELPGASVSAELAPLQRENLVAWCIVPFDVKKRGPEERAAMLARLGIRRAAYDWREEHVGSFEDEILAYQRYGIEYFAFWGVHEEAFRLFEKYSLRPQIWQTLQGVEAPSQAERVRRAAERLLPLVAQTQEMGSKLGLYNHGGWGGEPENLIAVCQYLREHHDADHVGIVYNFHHGHEHVDSFDASFEQMLPFLHCVNLNGMNPEAQPKILPVGSGQDEAAMVATLLTHGYQGPIGILGHIATEDVEISLRNNLKGLANLVERLP